MVEFIKDVKHCCSPTRWLARISNLLLKYVGQKTILAFLFLEVLFAALTGWFFFYHRAVAYLSFWGWTFKAFMVSAGVRFNIALFGFYAVWARKIQWTKIYFGLFFIAGFLTFLAVQPVQWTKCTCNNWMQCKALTAFQPRGETLMNPHQHPDAVRFENKRKVPYKEPPAEPEKAIPFDESVYEQKATLADDSFMELSSRRLPSEATEDFDGAGSRGRLVNKRRGPVQSMLPEPPLQKLVPTRKVPRRPSAGIALSAELAAALLEDNPKSQKQKDKKKKGKGQNEDLAENMEAHPLRFFNTTVKGIDWVGLEKPWCEPRKITEKHKIWLDRQFKKAWEDDMSTVLDEYIIAKLFICAVDPACAGVSAALYKSSDPRAKHPFYTLLCQHFLQLVPQPEDTSTLPDNETPVAKIFFQRNPVAIKKELELTNSNPTKFYQKAFRRLDKNGGMKYLKKLQKYHCMCEEEDGGCKTYTDTLGNEKFWCYIKESQRETCIEEGLQLFWDKKEERIWSFDICAKAGCECSNLGMLPQNIHASNINTSILVGNQLNFGTECKRWTTDTALPWCYIGWSSTCADRYLDGEWWTSIDHPVISSYRLKMQYRSSLPCNEEEQEELRERTESRCMDTTSIIEFLFLINFLMYVPMIVIIFKFLSNRCGDEFHLEEQFAVVLTTDEEESEDDFVSGHCGEGGSDSKSGEKEVDAERSVK